MRLSAIVCMASNRVIGKENTLPWRLPADLQHFKSVTMSHPIIMGRKTYESVGRPLPGRRNIVVTRDTGYQADGCDVFHSLDDVFSAVQSEKEVFVIGGANIYETLMPRVDRLYLTMVHADVEGDAFFPEVESHFSEISRVDHKANEKNEYDYSFITLERN